MEYEALLQEFLAESREHLSGIEVDLLAIEEGGANINENLVNKVFRAAHSIKGGSGFFDLTVIQELAHRAETVLSQIRSKEMVPNAEVINILLQAFDKLRELIGDPAASARADISDFVVALGGLTSSYLPEAEKGTLSRTTDLTPRGFPWPITVSEIDFIHVKKTGKHIYALEYDLARDLEAAGRTPLEMLDLLESCGNVLDAKVRTEAIGSLEDFQLDRIPFLVIFATVLEPSLAAGIFELPPPQVHHLYNPDSRPKPAVKPLSAAKTPTPEAAVPAPVPSAPPAKAPAGQAPPKEAITAEHASTGETTLRVQISVLENLMNLAGELVLSRNQLRESISRGDARATFASSQRINLVTSELQEAIMQTRLQPIGNLFGKFPRVVRDLAQKLEKDIQLTMEGKDVELDKTLLEGLSDPLTHMVRNAVDHGIESPSDRSRAGKPVTGRVQLRAFHEAGQVVIEVADDGKGLDPEKLAASALAKGLMDAEQVKGLSDREKIGIIFLPGFSTAENVTDVSGRGVGMDVVKTNLDRLGGKVEIDSRLGQGTLFRIKLPLTLAIIPSLVFSVGDERFAIPQVNIVELIRVAAEQVQKRIEIVGDSEVLLLRGQLIPLVRFADLLGIPRAYVDPGTGEARPDRREMLADRRSHRSPVGGVAPGAADGAPGAARRGRGRRTHPSGDLHIVVISTGLMQYGLVVDRMHATEEIVVKPLGRHLKGLAEYAGATIMGDGRVALILDAAGLAGKANLVPISGSARAQQLAEEARAERTADAHSFLTFHNGPAEFCAIPLDLILRVERIQASQIETYGGRRTMQYRGSSLPLLALEDAAQVQALDGQELAVIIFNASGREIGLQGALPVDVLETRITVDQTVLRQKGIAGSAVVKDQTMLMVDVFELVESTHPEWLAPAQEALRRGGAEPPTILLAEDSVFFRGQVKRYLEGEGYRVLDAPDGEAAWDLLVQHAAGIAGLVTDIEMPRLTGLGLAARIRAHPSFHGLPIVGLTSLAAEDDIAKGKAAGIDDYQIKLDRDRLLEGLRTLLASKAVPGTPRA